MRWEISVETERGIYNTTLIMVIEFHPSVHCDIATWSLPVITLASYDNTPPAMIEHLAY